MLNIKLSLISHLFFVFKINNAIFRLYSIKDNCGLYEGYSIKLWALWIVIVIVIAIFGCPQIEGLMLKARNLTMKSHCFRWLKVKKYLPQQISILMTKL